MSAYFGAHSQRQKVQWHHEIFYYYLILTFIIFLGCKKKQANEIEN